MKKKVLIFCANPNPKSFSLALANQYKKSAIQAGAEVVLYNLIDLNFNYNLTPENKYGGVMEPELVKIQQEIIKADHLVFVYPNWWSTYPAILKAFIDRVFIKGYAYKYEEGSRFQIPLLKGKTARLIVTMDTPKWYYKLIYKQPGHNAMKRGFLNFCGIKPVRITSFNDISKTDIEKRKKYLQKIAILGNKLI